MHQISHISHIYTSQARLGNGVNFQVQTFMVLRVPVCENCIVYCADRIRSFPGKRRSQEVQDFTGKHAADFANTKSRPAGSYNLWPIHYLAQSIKQALLSLRLKQQMAILNRKRKKSFSWTITYCKNKTRQRAEPVRGDYHQLDNLRVSPPPPD